MFKISHNLVKCNIAISRVQDRNPYPVRNKQDFNVFASITNRMAKGIMNSATNEYNRLPSEIKAVQSFPLFIKLVKE